MDSLVVADLVQSSTRNPLAGCDPGAAWLARPVAGAPDDYRVRAGQRGPLFFMHIPKTAGMALRSYLANQYEAKDICPANSWAALAQETEADLARYRLVQGHYSANLAALLDPAIKTLVVLREPVARTVSVLRHIRRDPRFHVLHARAKTMSLREMVQDEPIMAAAANGQVGILSSMRPAGDILAYARASAGTHASADPYSRDDTPILERAMRRLERIDFVGLTERLGELVHVLAREMRFHPILRLPVVNDAPDEADTLSPADLERVSAMNTLDSRLCDYAGRLMDRRFYRDSFEALLDAGVYQVPAGDFEIALSGAMPGSGWYEPECENGTFWRWTGPGSRFTLELALCVGASYDVAMEFTAGMPAQAETISVVAGDEPLRAICLPEGAGFKCTFRLSPSAIETTGLCRIVIDAGSTFRPSDHGAIDVRSLGLCVTRLRFTRTPSLQ